MTACNAIQEAAIGPVLFAVKTCLLFLSFKFKSRKVLKCQKLKFRIIKGVDGVVAKASKRALGML